jgi:hypothetical protein
MNATQTSRAALKQSRAALRTIQLAVDTVADSIRQLRRLQGHAHRGHRAALATVRMARHHSLNGGDKSRVEETVGKFARLMDWPLAMRSRSRVEPLERPLSDAESRLLANLAGSALLVAGGMLDITEQLDAWYGGLVVTAAAAARSALPSVTSQQHRERADKLMLRLEELCANAHIAWAFAVGEEAPPPPLRTLH